MQDLQSILNWYSNNLTENPVFLMILIIFLVLWAFSLISAIIKIMTTAISSIINFKVARLEKKNNNQRTKPIKPGSHSSDLPSPSHH